MNDRMRTDLVDEIVLLRQELKHYKETCARLEASLSELKALFVRQDTPEPLALISPW